MEEYFSFLMNGINKKKSSAFPFYTEKRKLSDYSPNLVHCHWHHDVQITYIIKGSMTCQVNSKSYKMTAGSSIFINSDALHILKPLSTDSDCEFLSFMWEPSIISGGECTSVFHKYILPICSGGSISSLFFRPDTFFSKKSYPILLAAATLLDTAEAGYELLITEKLCTLWVMLYQQAVPYENKKEPAAAEMYRLKSGLEFIQYHYKENISLQDISNACHISKSECCHLFKRTLNETPISLLSNYRIQASLLPLLDGNKSTADIASELGFNGSSYFSETFRKIMNCSPREYRKQHTLNSINEL